MVDVHKSRVFLWMLLAVIAGVALRSFVAVPYLLIVIGFLAGCVLLAVGFSGKDPSRMIYGFVLISFFTGVLRFDVATRANPNINSLVGKSVTVRGVVWTEPVFGPQSQTLQVRISALDNRDIRAPFMIRAVSKKYPAYEIGEELLFSGRISDSADSATLQNNAPTQQLVILFPHIEKTNASNQRPIMRALANLKRAFETNIDAALPEPHAAFLKGLLLGERASLPADLIDSFKKTGTSHMVALSGYNITIVGRSLSRVLMLLAVPFYASFWVVLCAMILFVVMTGASASAVRAGIIAVLALVADREGRPYQMTNALACAGAVMLMVDSTLLRFDVGFQLSFLATMGLVYWSPWLERGIENIFDRFKKLMGVRPASRALQSGHAETTPRIFLTMKRLLIETLAAELAVLPLLIYLFGYLSIVSPLANIAALIAVPAAMGVGFFTGLAGFVSSGLASVIGVASWLMLEYIMDAVGWFAAFPYASVELGAIGIWTILVLYGMIAWRAYRRRKSSDRQTALI
ncbi:MAG: ComEC/Rec2 family competence protein [Candidatus Sungbacteria bacterium]|nr:ComEC/Rec2 family competence protein [Candidatus Sungbacteria bacterium]